MATWTAIGPRSVQSIQSTNDTQPPANTTDGLNLDSVAGFTVHISCDTGQTFNNAASTFQAWRYSITTGRWSRAPENDITVGATGVGVRDIAVSFQVASPRGQIAHIATSVGVTGGGLTLTYECNALAGMNA